MTLRQRGFALMLAVFLIVTLAAIGVYLLTVSTAQVEAGTQDEQGARAYQAARTGIEWGAFQVLRNPPCAAGPTDIPLPQGFSARVTCAAVGTETEGTTTFTVYLITSTGCNANPCTPTPASPSRTYVERQLQLTVVSQ